MSFAAEMSAATNVDAAEKPKNAIRSGLGRKYLCSQSKGHNMSHSHTAVTLCCKSKSGISGHCNANRKQAGNMLQDQHNWLRIGS
jgi:hypothetical protein